MGVDPGRNRPLSVCTIACSELPKEWTDDRRVMALDKSMDDNDWITNIEYRTHTGSIEAEKKEKIRRVGDYKTALESFAGTKQQTALLEENTTYYSTLLKHWSTMRNEMMNIKRSYHKFKSFSQRQKSIAYFAKKMASRLTKMCKDSYKKGLIFFGNGTFNPGGSGHASVPRKTFIRQFATMFPVVITNENRSSIIYPLSFKELENKENTSSSKPNERLRQCKTESGNSKVDEIVLKAYLQPSLGMVVRDRDNFGSCSITQNGFYRLIKNPIDAFIR